MPQRAAHLERLLVALTQQGDQPEAAGETIALLKQQVSQQKDLIERLRATHAGTAATPAADRERAEAQLRLRMSALEAAANGIVLTDERGTILWANPAFAAMTGYSVDEVLGKNPRVFKSGQHDRAFYDRLWATISAGRVWQGEIINRRKDGTFYYEEMTITPVAAEGAVYYIAVKQDVTERKTREGHLERLNRVLRAKSNSSGAMMRAVEESSYLREVCRIIVEDCGHAMVWIGYAQDDPEKGVLPVAQSGFETGYLEALRVSWADVPRGQGPTGTAIRTGKPCLCRDMRSDPKFAPWRDEALRRGYASSLVLPLMREGAAFGALSIYATEPDGFSDDETQLLTDLANDLAYGITALRLREDQRRAEEQLQHAKDAAEKANQAKDQFLAVLSHELRTPLAPVLTTAQMMEGRSHLSKEDRDMIGLIRRNVEIEVKLIDDLLNLTRITRGKLELHKVTTDFHAKLGYVVAMFAEDIHAKNLELSVDMNADEHFVHADAPRLQQVFWNLLKNAIKFTPVGGHIRITTVNGTPGSIELTVSDSGMGIEPAVLPRIFNAFEQGSSDITRQFGGLGLGLAISKALVEKHGGTISASSGGKGCGATFTVAMLVTKPGMYTMPPVERAVRPELGRQCSVLLVEDHADTRQTMCRLLASFGYHVETAGSVQEALAIEDGFDLLISDIGLPDGSGMDVVKEIKSRYPDIRSIALSGFGMEQDVRNSLDAGFDRHLTKPVDMQVLANVLQELTGQ